MKATPFLYTLPLLLCLSACGGNDEAARPEPVAVEGNLVVLSEPDKAAFLKLSTVEEDRGGVMRLPGRLIWNEEKTARVVPQVAGRVSNIAVDVGQRVKKGDLLAMLESPDFGEALADTRKAQAEVGLAQKAQERNRLLFEAGVIAEKELQQSDAAALAARAESERTRRRLAGLGGGGDAYALRAPLAGTVVERNINPGLEYRPDQEGKPLFVVTDPANLWVRIDATEQDLGRLREGADFSLVVRQYPDERFTGRILRMADFVDPVSRTIQVRGEVANADRRLKGEMFVEVLIDTPPSGWLRVPSAAVFLAGEQRYAFVEEGGGRYRRQAVTVGADRDGWIEVRSGLKVGEKVVVEGNLHLLKYFKDETGDTQASPRPADQK